MPWRQAGALALLCSGVAMAALPRADATAGAEAMEWHALGIAPLSVGGRTGLRQVATEAVEPIEFAPNRPTLDLSMTLGAVILCTVLWEREDITTMAAWIGAILAKLFDKIAWFDRILALNSAWAR